MHISIGEPKKTVLCGKLSVGDVFCWNGYTYMVTNRQFTHLSSDRVPVLLLSDGRLGQLYSLGTHTEVEFVGKASFEA